MRFNVAMINSCVNGESDEWIVEQQGLGGGYGVKVSEEEPPKVSSKAIEGARSALEGLPAKLKPLPAKLGGRVSATSDKKASSTRKVKAQQATSGALTKNVQLRAKASKLAAKSGGLSASDKRNLKDQYTGRSQRIKNLERAMAGLAPLK